MPRRSVVQVLKSCKRRVTCFGAFNTQGDDAVRRFFRGDLEIPRIAMTTSNGESFFSLHFLTKFCLKQIFKMRVRSEQKAHYNLYHKWFHNFPRIQVDDRLRVRVPHILTKMFPARSCCLQARLRASLH
jgi:hypothetical protein